MNFISSLKSRFVSTSGFSRSVIILTAGTVIGQAIGVLSSPILTRLYTTEQFGHLAVFMSVLGFGGAIVSLRYEIAVLLPEDSRVAANVTAVALLVVLAISLSTGGAMFVPFVVRRIPNWLQPYLWLVPLGVLGLGIYQVLSYWAVRSKAYLQLSQTKLTQSVSRAAIQIALGFFKGGLFGLLLGDTIGRLSGSLPLARSAWRGSSEDFRAVSFAGMKSAASRYRRFPLVLTFAAVANTAGSSVPIVLIAAWFGPEVLGWYALVDRTMAVPVALIGQAVSQVYSSEAARLLNSDPQALNPLFLNTIKKLALIAAVPSLVILLLGPPIFRIVFGSAWSEAGVYAQLMIGMQFLGFVSWPVIPTLSILERQSLQFIWDVGRGVLSAGILVVCHLSELSARRTVFYYGVVLTLVYLAHILLSRWAIQAHVREHKISKDPPLVGPTIEVLQS